MGNYLNPGSDHFKMSLNSEIYVDKSELISKTNAVVRTRQRFLCISRPRRFGKTMAAEMLAAYYGRGEDTDSLFQGLKISRDPSYLEHLNKYNCITINVQAFLSDNDSVDEMIGDIKQSLYDELEKAYPDVKFRKPTSIVRTMMDVYASCNRLFVILIDEWDCLFREYKYDVDSQTKYLDFLRMWLKDQSYVGLAYMTGILPIKKYGSGSALNMFSEYSMTDPRSLAPYFGFTEEEVLALCMEYQMSFEETKAWYDGYHMQFRSGFGFAAPLKHISIYSPKSLIESLFSGKFGTYWAKTETYEALELYIKMNMDGLKDAIVTMLSGGSVKINTGTFANDMITFKNRDDVLTLLVHLGYLTYNESESTVSIPNKEVSTEYENSIRVLLWKEVMHSIEDSERLLKAVWDGDAAAVAEGVERAHQEVSILQYNDENALSYTIGLAFYFAREYYTVIRQLPSGKGFADVVMIPRKIHADKPALVIELKWDKSTKGAIEQIKERQYIAALKEYEGCLILVGINYDKKTKAHECGIESLQYSPKKTLSE